MQPAALAHLLLYALLRRLMGDAPRLALTLAPAPCRAPPVHVLLTAANKDNAVLRAANGALLEKQVVHDF